VHLHGRSSIDTAQFVLTPSPVSHRCRWRGVPVDGT
jgi:hypothetical protein